MTNGQDEMQWLDAESDWLQQKIDERDSQRKVALAIRKILRSGSLGIGSLTSQVLDEVGTYPGFIHGVVNKMLKEGRLHEGVDKRLHSLE